MACNSQIESISLDLLASGLVFTRLIAPAYRTKDPEFSVWAHYAG